MWRFVGGAEAVASMILAFVYVQASEQNLIQTPAVAA
jgi:hypothetical protein